MAPEGKRTLSLKVLYALRWLYDGSRGGLQPAFVAKTDDDAYVCVGALVSLFLDITEVGIIFVTINEL